MRERISKLSSLSLAALIAISMMVLLPMPVKASPTNLEVIDPIDGDHNFFFDTSTTNVGDIFTVNITVIDVTDLQNWQIEFTFDDSLLDFVSIFLPSDHVFSTIDPPRSMVTPPPDIGVGYVIWGCTYINDPYWTFNGTGQLCQIRLRITQGVGELPPTEVQCDLALVDPVADTFMLNGNGNDIAFDIVNGLYKFTYIPPSYKPELYIKPAVCKPDKLGDTFGLEIWVKNVHAGWSIIGFQFSLMWNTTFIKPASPYWTEGEFLEAFEYYPNGVLYVADINQHNRPPPLTELDPQYNFSMFAALLLPDAGPPYHPPFPSVGSGGALLMTVYFEAIYETISPFEDWTWIEFIDFTLPFPPYEPQDTFALNQYLHLIRMDSTTDCHYRAPMKILGLAIDLYTQYDPPFGGQGPHQPSDMFGPQQLVDLFALVTYNEYPVQQKLVGFHIRHNGIDIYREDATDEDGIAHVTFRIPWPCVDPEAEIFGKWYVIATVEVAEMIENDTLGFWVDWKVNVLSVEPKRTEFEQRKTGGDDLLFTVIYGTYSMQLLDVTLTVTVYDELGFFIGSDYLVTTVGWDEYKYYDYMACEEPPFKLYDPWDVIIPMPTNAVVGKGQVFANAYTDFPWNGGVPYCPEVKNTIDFYIVKPP